MPKVRTLGDGGEPLDRCGEVGLILSTEGSREALPDLRNGRNGTVQLWLRLGLAFDVATAFVADLLRHRV